MSHRQTGNAASDVPLVRDPGLGRVTASGPDAAAFLEAQGMTALAGLPDYRLQRCAFADARGRVVAIALAWHIGDEWRLVLPASEAEWFVAHLLRFRFRAKVEIDASADWRVVALVGGGTGGALEAAGLELPAAGTAAATADGTEVLSIAGGDCLVAADDRRMDEVIDLLGTVCTPADTALWDGVRMRAGEAMVREPTRGRFLPQFLDLDRHGVIAWNKGCYPGQEVIARLQHRGTVKYRLLLLAEDVDGEPGTRTEVAGVTVEVLGHGRLSDGRVVTQVVAPYPFDPGLEELDARAP